MPLFNLYKKLTEDPKKVLEDKIKKQEDRIDLFSNSLKETIERERESSRHMMEKNPKYWENSFAHIIEARTEKIKIKYFILAEKFRYETEATFGQAVAKGLTVPPAKRFRSHIW